MVGNSETQQGSSDPSAASWEGAKVGDRYVLRSVLGRGASGVVWRATHEALTRDYAIKFLEPAAGTGASSADEIAERFHFEAQISCRLGAEMENIVAVHDAGLFRGQPYMVMDLVRGDSLLSIIRRGPMHIGDIARMTKDIAAALTVCHAEGLAHRDTKPANILYVESTKRYRLTDFGLAKFFGERPSNVFLPRDTTGSMLIGTPAYMSPEAISAERTRCGRGDVWSLAVSLYECLTGALPFQGEGWPSVAVSIMKRRYKHPSQVHPELMRFDSIFVKAFASDIEDRFQTANELVAALDAAMTVQTRRPVIPTAIPISKTPLTVRAVREPEPSEPILPQTFTVDSVAAPALRAHKGRWAYAAVGVAALVVGAAVGVMSFEERPARSTASAVPPLVGTEPVAATPSSSASALPTAAPVASARASGHPATHPARSADAGPAASAGPRGQRPFDASEVW